MDASWNSINDIRLEKILALSKIGKFAVYVSPISILNTSKGVAVCHDLLSYSEQEIVKELSTRINRMPKHVL